jgi:hypothetical protein
MNPQEKSKEAQIMNHLVDVVRPQIIAATCEVRTCIISTRIGMEVLRRFGIAARAMPVHVDIYRSLSTSSRRKKKGSQLETHAHVLGTDRTLPEDGTDLNRYNCHLVVVTETAMLDLSFDQFTYPHLGIVTQSTWGPCPNLSGGQPSGGVVNGHLVRWTPASNQTYKKSPDWFGPLRDDLQRIVDRACWELLASKRAA